MCAIVSEDLYFTKLRSVVTLGGTSKHCQASARTLFSCSVRSGFAAILIADGVGSGYKCVCEEAMLQCQ